MTTNPKPKLLGSAVVGGAFLLGLAACGLQSASTPIGATGGTVTLESGLSLSVPPGALGKPEVVTLREARGEAADRVEVEPAGTALAQPAVLSWSDDGRTESVEQEDGGQLPVHHQCGRAHVHVRHFGHFSCHHPADGGVGHGGGDLDGGRRDGHGGDGHGGGHDGEDHDGHLDGGGGDHHDDDDAEDRDDDDRADGGCPAIRPDAGTPPGPTTDGGIN